MTHSACLAPILGGSLAAGLAGDGLVLAEVRQRARLLERADAGVERDHRDTRGDGLLDRRHQRRRVGQA